MKINEFIDALNCEFYTGVPDSLLKHMSSYLMSKYGSNNKNHIIAANEGNAVGLAAGYYMATKKYPVVYMQNSGQGNAINPIASLLSEKVYGIPVIFVIGWRGKPGVHDEPQHVFQGEITNDLLKVLNIEHYIISKDTTKKDIEETIKLFNSILQLGRQVAFVVEEGAFESEINIDNKNKFTINREEALRNVIQFVGNDIVVSTTGKISREIFEIREQKKDSHDRDFLTVGSMGHASSIALGIALNKPMTRVWCIDGDGAILMHLGSLATIGSLHPDNFVHVVINNEAHESVGGMPITSKKIDYQELSKACGYDKCYLVQSFEELNKSLNIIKGLKGLFMIVICCEMSSRKDLGRPSISPKESLNNFIKKI